MRMQGQLEEGRGHESDRFVEGQRFSAASSERKGAGFSPCVIHE